MYTVRAYAYDTLGNWSQAEYSVNVASAANSLKVSSISLSGRTSGSTTSITGDVIVKDSRGQAVSNASVAIRWTLPNGTTRTAQDQPDPTGRARFTVSGPRGTYTLTVTGVTKQATSSMPPEAF